MGTLDPIGRQVSMTHLAVTESSGSRPWCSPTVTSKPPDPIDLQAQGGRGLVPGCGRRGLPERALHVVGALVSRGMAVKPTARAVRGREPWTR